MADILLSYVSLIISQRQDKYVETASFFISVTFNFRHLKVLDNSGSGNSFFIATLPPRWYQELIPSFFAVSPLILMT